VGEIVPVFPAEYETGCPMSVKLLVPVVSFVGSGIEDLDEPPPLVFTEPTPGILETLNDGAPVPPHPPPPPPPLPPPDFTDPTPEILEALNDGAVLPMLTFPPPESPVEYEFTFGADVTLFTIEFDSELTALAGAVTTFFTVFTIPEYQAIVLVC
jgi:hypothetical protein